MNRLTPAKRAQVVSCLVERNSIRSTVRMTGVAKNTVVKLLCDLGRACSDYKDRVLVNLKCKRLQCDEIWSFVKKLENHEHALALYFMYYNFCRIHSSLRITPAMAAGLSERVWELSDLVELLTAEEVALAA